MCTDSLLFADVALGFAVPTIELEEGEEPQTICVMVLNAVTLETSVEVMIAVEQSNQGKYLLRDL